MSIATESYANPAWDFSDRIRKVRRAIAKMTQADMAKELGVSQKAYAAWESGLSTPADIVAVAKRIAFRWRGQVTASWLLGVEERPTTPPDGGGESHPGESNPRPIHYKRPTEGLNGSLSPAPVVPFKPRQSPAPAPQPGRERRAS